MPAESDQAAHEDSTPESNEDGSDTDPDPQ